MPVSAKLATSRNDPASMHSGASSPFAASYGAAAKPDRDPDNTPGLQDLDFIEQVGEPRSLDPVHRHEVIQAEMEKWRQIFLDGLNRQMCLARDPEFRYPRQEFVECDGVNRREIVYVAPEPWWFERDGAAYIRLNFGERNWFVKGKNPLIRIGTMEELLPTLEKLHILVGTGEFDEIIEKMVIVSHR